MFADHTSPFSFFFFNDTATTEIYTLSLHDALPICLGVAGGPLDPAHQHALEQRTGPDVVAVAERRVEDLPLAVQAGPGPERKSTRLNSRHSQNSHAVFCLKKKKNRTFSHCTFNVRC